MLTGKCKEQFEKWLLNKEKVLFEGFCDLHHPEHFNQLSDSMKWGVIQDFADSVGCEMITTKDKKDKFSYMILWGIEIIIEDNKSTRSEARIAAIEKFNELYNEKNNRYEM